MMEDESEIALCQAYCVVYRLDGETKDNREWVCQHTGWAQVNLYEDPTDHTYRIVGWTLPDADAAKEGDPPEPKILVNSNVTNNCAYSKKSIDFLKYVDEDRIVFGFGFYKKDGVGEEAMENPKRFYDCLTELIDKLKEECGGEDDEDTRLAFNARTAKEGANTIKFTPVMKDAKGTLAIHAPTGAKGVNASEEEKGVSEAKDVKHVHSVQFDPRTRTYVGLPKEWEGLMNQQFGLDISRVECVRTPPYKSRIPAVLVQMLAYMRKESAFDIEGIFRLAAGSEEQSFVKSQLNNNTFKKCDDIHCISTLTKVFFRDLPKPLLDCVTHYSVVECTSPERAGEIVEKMPEPEGSVMLWLIDLCVECTLKCSVNKMTPTNLGIVIGPNLFLVSMVDPMASLQYSQKVALFLARAIVWRAHCKGHMEVKDTGPAKARTNAIEKTF